MESSAYYKLAGCGLKPSAQRIAILEYLLTHCDHPTVEEVHKAVSQKISTLSRTTVYNTLRLFAEHGAAQMVTIDDHHVCYEGNTAPHIHLLCKECGRVVDIFDEKAPFVPEPRLVAGNLVEEAQLYYKGVCADCVAKKEN